MCMESEKLKSSGRGSMENLNIHEKTENFKKANICVESDNYHKLIHMYKNPGPLNQREKNVIKVNPCRVTEV